MRTLSSLASASLNKAFARFLSPLMILCILRAAVSARALVCLRDCVRFGDHVLRDLTERL